MSTQNLQMKRTKNTLKPITIRSHVSFAFSSRFFSSTLTKHALNASELDVAFSGSEQITSKTIVKFKHTNLAYFIEKGWMHSQNSRDVKN